MDTCDNEINADATRPTLIKGLQASEESSWSRFYDMYAPMIVNFARKRGCTGEQAEDVLQETVVAVMRVIHKFDLQKKRGRFRSLLFKITESKIIDAYRRAKRYMPVDDPEVILKNQNAVAADNNAASNKWDETWNKFILSEAIKNVMDKIQPLTYSCFEQAFIKGRKVKDIAAEFDISPNLVAQHKHKVYNMIIKEAEKLNNEA